MSPRKRVLFDRLVAELRGAVGASARYDQAVADALGLNRTDTRCIDLLDREGHDGRLTAGELADRTGLTTGAITTVIDRLERAGLARRVADADDRRRVHVELTDTARGAADRFYADHNRRAEALYRRYTAGEIEFLVEFLQGVREFNEGKASALESELLVERGRRRAGLGS